MRSSNASIPVFPVTRTRPPTFSRRKLDALSLVGANRRSDAASIATRKSSSGHGFRRSWLRSPASTCATGTCGKLRAQRSAKRAGRIALDHDQLRAVEHRSDRPRDLSRMHVRVRATGAFQRDDRQLRHPVLGDAEVRMLAGEDDARADAAGDERFG